MKDHYHHILFQLLRDFHSKFKEKNNPIEWSIPQVTDD